MQCFNCGEEIDEENDEEIFYNDDGDPLCEQCYCEEMSEDFPITFSKKVMSKLEDFCTKQGISRNEAVEKAIKKYLDLE